MPRGGIAAEIGVDQGKFSERILQLAQRQRLYLIDPWLPDLTGLRIPAPEERYQNSKTTIGRRSGKRERRALA
jgi:hypothetical protein